LETYSDEQLIQLLKGGDREAFECIYRKYWPRLFDAAYKRVKSKEGAEEVIQELFTYIWCKREELQLTHAFSTYIHAALKYRIFNYIRNEVTKNKHIDSVKQTPPPLIEVRA
jgi:RNA polymerase sigma-70 factor (ECF subfamily)